MDTSRKGSPRAWLLANLAILGLQRKLSLHVRFIHSSFNAHSNLIALVRTLWPREAKQLVLDNTAGKPQPDTKAAPFSCTPCNH